MRHQKSTTKLSRLKAPREALFRDLITNLVLHEKIRTTEAKGAVLRSKAERLLTVARKGTLASRRQVAQVLRTPAAVKKLVETIAPRYAGRQGGYTRTVKIGPRRGDGAHMVLIAFV